MTGDFLFGVVAIEPLSALAIYFNLQSIRPAPPIIFNLQLLFASSTRLFAGWTMLRDFVSFEVP